MLLLFKYLGITINLDLKYTDFKNVKNKMRSLTTQFHKIRFLNKIIVWHYVIKFYYNIV